MKVCYTDGDGGPQGSKVQLTIITQTSMEQPHSAQCHKRQDMWDSRSFCFGQHLKLSLKLLHLCCFFFCFFLSFCKIFWRPAMRKCKVIGVGERRPPASRQNLCSGIKTALNHPLSTFCSQLSCREEEDRLSAKRSFLLAWPRNCGAHLIIHFGISFLGLTSQIDKALIISIKGQCW